MKNRQVNIRFTDQLISKMERAAKNQGIKFSEAVRAACVEYVNKYGGVKMFADLQELTGQESGIVIYENGAILCNWSSIKGLPRVFATGLIGMGEEIPEVEGERYEDLSEILEDINGEIIDMSAEQTGELPKSGTVYRINGAVTVIAPDDWA